jgi:hypothetical protein
MRKIAFIIVGVVIVGALLLISPFVYYGFKVAGQRRVLQSRSDYPQIAAACVTLARASTNESALIKPTDPIVPPILRSLSPRYISASSNHVTMEFHGGFDHYGYRVRQSDTNLKQWTISYYTEQGERLLTTISHD